MLEVNERISIPLKEFDFSFARSSGPGGQNVNKVNTKVTLHWPIMKSADLPVDVRDRFLDRYPRRINRDGQVVVISERFRDQGRNVADCLNKLRDLILAVATAPKKRKPTKPTRGSRERRLQGKRQKSEKKQSRRKKWRGE
jgi:ribosome-associated protein